MRYAVGIDIGSTASKVVILEGRRIADHFTLPTGWNGKETAGKIYELLARYAGALGAALAAAKETTIEWG